MFYLDWIPNVSIANDIQCVRVSQPEPTIELTRSYTVYISIGVDLGGSGGAIAPPKKIVRGESIFSPPQEWP